MYPAQPAQRPSFQSDEAPTAALMGQRTIMGTTWSASSIARAAEGFDHSAQEASSRQSSYLLAVAMLYLLAAG